MDPSPTSTTLYYFFHDGQEETTRIGPNKKTNNMLITAEEEEESGTVEGKGTITYSICTALLDKKNEQHQQNSLQRRKLLLGGVPPMHQMLDKEQQQLQQQQQQKQRQQDQQQEEEIDLKSFRAKLEQNLERSNSCSHIVVNLDDHFKQQRIKKLMDLKKKTEASNFLQSYKNADLTALSKQLVSHQKSPVSAAGGDVENEFACQKIEKARGDLSTAKAQQPVMNMNGIDEYSSDHGSCDVCNRNNNDNDNNGSIDASLLDNGPEEEKLQHKHIDIDETKTPMLCKRMEKETEQKVATDDISISISSYKHLLAPPPKRNYRKLFLSSCWCSE